MGEPVEGMYDRGGLASANAAKWRVEPLESLPGTQSALYLALRAEEGEAHTKDDRLPFATDGLGACGSAKGRSAVGDIWKGCLYSRPIILCILRRVVVNSVGVRG